MTLIIILLFVDAIAYSQECRTEIGVDFRVNSVVLDSTYSDNAARMREIVSFLRNVRNDHAISIIEVSFRGAASPEGSDQLNRRLARGRLAALEKFVRNQVDIPDSVITRSDNYIPWNYLKSQIKASDLPHKDTVLAILNEEPLFVNYHQPNTQIDNRVEKLKALDGGKVWQQINNRYFRRMRNAYAVLVTYKQEPLPAQDSVVVCDTVPVEPVAEVVEVEPDTAVVAEPVIQEIEEPIVMQAEKWQRRLYVKTNAVEWLLAIGNIAAEIDLAPRFSVSLPISYSGWNYFTSTTKFRTFSLYPELRYWLRDENNGFFAGVHFGLAWYNFAIGGKYRYQDKGGHTPALGGGATVGYRTPISKNRRWHAEFALGFGVYRLCHDKYINRRNGALIATERHTYAGPDQVSLSIAYSFDIR
ncbi:MAG: DUF3575 domain-containing protein [Muribaculaceae bacterium]